jgi:hypothetical protein
VSALLPPDAAEVLWAERSIERVLRTYARAADHRDAARILDCFHPDARIEEGEFSGGPDALVDWLEALQPSVDRTAHLLGPPLIELDVPGGSAEVESSCVQVRVLPRDAQGVTHQALLGLRWVDRFELRSGSWRIASRRGVTDWSQALTR